MTDADLHALVAEVGGYLRQHTNGKQWLRVDCLLDAITALRAENARLREALTDTLERYVSLANSGDCGHWDCETELHVIASRQALGDSK